MTLKILLFFFLSNLYFVIPKSNELCIHQVPLVTLFFTIYFRSIMMKRRPANHARSSIFFKLKRNSPFLLHPKKVCLYFAYNSKCVCTWTVVREQGQPRVEARQLACERRKKSNFYSSHYSLIKVAFLLFLTRVAKQCTQRLKPKICIQSKIIG